MLTPADEITTVEMTRPDLRGGVQTVERQRERYVLGPEIASGGMATVHHGRLVGPAGFSRPVAIKRLLPYLAGFPEFLAMFLDEARVSARVRHPNVVPTIDIVDGDEVLIVMEYVQGETLAKLMTETVSRGERIPVPIACALMVGVLHGLNAAHEAVDDQGEPLGIVHRDVSPQNVMVGQDGIARLVDFGIAKANRCLHVTRERQLKGKLGYIAPELIAMAPATPRADVYSASVVFWEMLTGDRLIPRGTDATMLELAMTYVPTPPSRAAREIPKALDAIVLRGLSRDPAMRFETARDMARAIEDALDIASVSTVAEWVQSAGQKREAPAQSQRPKLSTWAAAFALAMGALFACDAPVHTVHARAATPTIVAAVPEPRAVVRPDIVAPTRAAVAHPSRSLLPQRTASAHRLVRNNNPCSTPTAIDESGVKHYKLECL